jgi:hypothetical protein
LHRADDYCYRAGYRRSLAVPGTAGPWLQSLNPHFDYGVHDNTPPVVFAATPGNTLTIKYVSGLVADSSGVGAQFFDANGGPSNFPTNNYCCSNGVLPALYMTPTPLVYLTELVGTFANDGVIVGKPFAIGNGPKAVEVPDGATQLLLGVNDNLYGAPSPNQGAFTATISAACNPCITNPKDGASPQSQFAALSGTGTPGNILSVLVGGFPAGSVTVDSEGNWEALPYVSFMVLQLRFRFRTRLLLILPGFNGPLYHSDFLAIPAQ